MLETDNPYDLLKQHGGRFVRFSGNAHEVWELTGPRARVRLTLSRDSKTLRDNPNRAGLNTLGQVRQAIVKTGARPPSPENGHKPLAAADRDIERATGMKLFTSADRARPAPVAPAPGPVAVPVVSPLICLECGREFRHIMHIARHRAATHGRESKMAQRAKQPRQRRPRVRPVETAIAEVLRAHAALGRALEAALRSLARH